MAKTKDPTDELEILHARSAAPLADALTAVLEAEVPRFLLRAADSDPRRYRSSGRIPVEQERAEALANLADQIAAMRIVADLLARERVVQETRARDRLPLAAAYPRPLAGPDRWRRCMARIEDVPAVTIPRVTFRAAVAAIVNRTPELAQTVDEVQAAYERGKFALAKSARLKVTERVQEIIAAARQSGAPLPTTVEAIQEAGPFTKHYAENVLRTNNTTAYAAGRFRQAMAPATRRVIGALRYMVVGDSRTRKNHRAANGLVAAPDDRVWASLSPPLGYQCRCSLALVDWITLERSGYLVGPRQVRRAKVPSGAHADSGFTRTKRPDVEIYGGAA